jgi:hypothetical protein
MRTKLPFLILFTSAVSLSASGCIPMRVSSRCNEEINRCMGNCPPQLMTGVDQQRFGSFPEQRSSCERQCQDRASSCQADEDRAKIKQDPLPATPTGK